MQAAAQKALQEGLRELDKRRGWRGPVEHKDIKDIDVKKRWGAKMCKALLSEAVMT